MIIHERIVQLDVRPYLRKKLLPSFILSLLWMNISVPWLVIAVVSGIAQLAAVTVFMFLWFRSGAFSHPEFRGWHQVYVQLALTALFVKIVLELGSSVPVLESLVFSTRNIVIGYLHLVLLGFVSFMLLAFAFHMNWLNGTSAQAKYGSILLLAGFFLNEAVLFLDGLLQWICSSGLQYQSYLLLVASLLLLAGIAVLQLPQKRRSMNS